jgi:hypothetical protein
MLSLNTGSSGLMDTVSGRREFGSVKIYERVVDTDDRTINIDSIATVSVGVVPNRFLRWLVWAVAGAVALVGLSALGGSLTRSRFDPADLLGAIVMFAVAVAIYFFGRRFTDTYLLVIGASDGSRTVFPSRNLKHLHEVKDFLTRKINEQDVSATLAADFKAAMSRPIVHNNNYGGTQYNNNGNGAMAIGDGNQMAVNSPGATVGNGNLHVNGSGNRIGTQETSYALNGASGVQIGTGNVAVGNTSTATHLDFSGVLPQVVELHRYYAQQANSRHVEERLMELEMLMRSGAASQQQRSRIRELAGDLGHILQAYPAMVQFFGHVGRMVGLA